jgi:hypothetical protein
MKPLARLLLRIRLLGRGLTRLPVIRLVRFAMLRRVSPLSSVFGYDRGGLRLGRYYIDKFLANNRADIRGRVLEIADNYYTTVFGGDRVLTSDVLHAEAGNPAATIVSDLTTGEGIADDTYDCIILTQTLQSIFDVQAVVGTLYRILKRGGVVLATGNGISQVSRYDMERWGDYWRFTTLSARRLFESHFPAKGVAVEAYGNVLAAFAVLQGLTVEELTQQEIEYRDPDYQVMICIRAQKEAELPGRRI